MHPVSYWVILKKRGAGAECKTLRDYEDLVGNLPSSDPKTIHLYWIESRKRCCCQAGQLGVGVLKIAMDIEVKYQWLTQ